MVETPVHKAELNFLLAQINPHFYIIHWHQSKLLAGLNRNDDINKTVVSLIKILNATISDEDEYNEIKKRDRNSEKLFYYSADSL